MDTIYNRNIWKRRSLFGYSPEAIRHEIYEMQDAHSMVKESLLSKLEERKKKYNELTEYIVLLKKQLKEKGPIEEEITSVLLEKLLETTSGLARLRDDHDCDLNHLGVQLENKRKERAHLVEQLKETLQQLHTTFTNLGGMRHE